MYFLDHLERAGFVSLEEVRRAAERDAKGQGQLLFDGITDEINKIEEDAETIRQSLKIFHLMQVGFNINGKDFYHAKKQLSSRMVNLAEKLNLYLAREYNVNVDSVTSYKTWKKKFQPFHWFLEFNGIIDKGGFNAIIGNPPYVVYSPAQISYSIPSSIYRTLGAKNLGLSR